MQAIVARVALASVLESWKATLSEADRKTLAQANQRAQAQGAKVDLGFRVMDLMLERRKSFDDALQTAVALLPTRTAMAPPWEAAYADLPSKVSPGDIRRINQRLSAVGFDGNKSWRSVSQGLSEMQTVLAEFGIEVADILSAHIFNKPAGRHPVNLAFSNKVDAMAPKDIVNTQANVSWYQHQSGNFEVLVYLS